MAAPATPPSSIQDVLGRNLVFVSGKGGVGKTVVSQAIALTLAARGSRTLWVTFEDPIRPPGETRQVSPGLWHLNCEATAAFEEYAAMKIGGGALTRIFLQNKLVRYLAKAAPGIHELVLLGKVWFERKHYDCVVIDMPATGHGLAMFQSTRNFTHLFKGGPLNRDAEAMLETFSDPKVSGQLIVALPEEMPLRESLELNSFLLELFPENPPAFLVNRLFPKLSSNGDTESPDSWPSPVAESALDYVRKRSVLEQHNLRIWRERGISFAEIDFVPPPRDNAPEVISAKIAEQIRSRGYA